MYFYFSINFFDTHTHTQRYLINLINDILINNIAMAPKMTFLIRNLKGLSHKT